jgi:hypothetical protein
VNQFLSALDRRDCASLRASLSEDLARQLDEMTCSAFLDRARRHAHGMVITNTGPDGRAHDALLVEVRARAGGPGPSRLIRVQHLAGQWRIAAL